MSAPGRRSGPLHSLTDAADSALIGSRGWRRIRSTSRLVSEFIARLRGRSDILDVEPNYIVQATTTVPNDPMFGNLWGLLNAAHPGADVHVTSAWDIVTGATANVIGVVDSGVDYTHPDLAANMWSAPDDFTITVGGHGITCLKGSHGFNAILLTCDPKDDYFHGTHVAGTIGAVGNNVYGAVGVNWSTRIMALKFLAANGSGRTADAVNAIDFAIKSKGGTSLRTEGAPTSACCRTVGEGELSPPRSVTRSPQQAMPTCCSLRPPAMRHRTTTPHPRIRQVIPKTTSSPSRPRTKPMASRRSPTTARRASTSPRRATTSTRQCRAADSAPRAARRWRRHTCRGQRCSSCPRVVSTRRT